MNTQFDLEAHPEFAKIWDQAAPYTMMSPARGFALYQAVNAVIDNNVPGNFVECGVWKGGSIIIIVQALIRRGARREIYMFDTFDSAAKPKVAEGDVKGQDAATLKTRSASQAGVDRVEPSVSENAVKSVLSSLDYPQQLLNYVKGDIGETLKSTRTWQIALLLMSTRFYQSTLSSLDELWRRLVQGGLYIIDDYGDRQGASKAFQEFFDDQSNEFSAPLLWRIESSGYAGVKLQDRLDFEIERYDYVPAGFESPDLLHLFPCARAKDPKTVNWPYLRHEVPHIWRCDSRDDKPWSTGNASVEEGACLYTLAKLFKGRRAIEIGSHFGWTAANILAAGVHLDCVDPEFNVHGRSDAVAEALDQVETDGRYRLWGGFSPDFLGEVSRSGEGKYSFALIDGNHDGEAPRQDALSLLPHLADDCLVVFHDLTSPFVERGLYALREAGFQTRLYNTMQILGVAWRGDVDVPHHKADPNVPIFLPGHLYKYDR